jgi:hypothetical protein
MNELDIIDISSDWSTPGPKLNLGSSNSIFGDGIELLMNEKKSSGGSGSSNVNFEDLNSLEQELNSLVDDTGGGDSSSSKNIYINKSNIFEPSVRRSDHGSESHSVKFSPEVGSGVDSKSWDGFNKFNDIPIDPERHVSSGPQMTKEELLREKFKFLRRLEALEAKGINLTKKYTMESPLAEMQGEYEMIMDEKAKQNSLKFSANMLMASINALEFLNSKFDPFDIKLDGWSEQIQENLTDYDDVFGELYEKYKSKASMAPELKLMFQLGGSAMMVHMTNTMFKSAMPGMDDILRQNPDLMRQFQTAAVNSMGEKSPGLSGFMNGMMNDGGKGPPPPMATKETGPNIYSRPGNNSYGSSSMNMGKSNFSSNNDGININIKEPTAPVRSARTNTRAEMNGPSDISELLSGLKTKTINIQQQQQQNNNDSTISISDMKEMQGDGNNIKRSSRRPNKSSGKNTLSLDI